MKQLAAFAILAGLVGCSSSEPEPEADPLGLLDSPDGTATPKKGTPGKTTTPAKAKPAKSIDPDALFAEMDAAAANQEDAARRLASAREEERKRRDDMSRLETELQRKRAQVEADERKRREHDAEMAKLTAENRTFEERYAAEILNVKRELEKYQR